MWRLKEAPLYSSIETHTFGLEVCLFTFSPALTIAATKRLSNDFFSTGDQTEF